MNKLIYGIIAVVVVLVVGVGAYLVVGRSETENPETVTPNLSNDMQRAPDEAIEETTSLRDMISEGQNQLCTFSDSETGGVGTVFIGDGNIRGDFQSDIDDAATVAHLVVLNSEDAYVWMEGQTQGYKASMSELTDLSNAAGGDKSLDVNKAVDYECYPWTPDASQFELPDTVDFQDMSAMMEGAENFEDQISAQCSACASLPADAQEACLQQLNCN